MKIRFDPRAVKKVVVVGSGLAGVCAAIEAATCGATVVVLEKADASGGNSAKATSGINGCGTRMQTAQGITDNPDRFLHDIRISGQGGVCQPDLAQTVAHTSAEAVHWLASVTGLDLSVISQLGGHSAPRTHRLPDAADGQPVPVGFAVMQRLQAYMASHFSDRITVINNVCVTALLTAQALRPAVVGVQFTGVSSDGISRQQQLMADSVILASGGFSSDHTERSLLAEFRPDLASMPTTNGAFATGDGIRMVRKVGATLLDMDKVQLHPTGLIDPAKPAAATKFLGPEALRGSGGILLTPAGARFVDELALRSDVSAAIKALGNDYPGSNGLSFAYCLLNRPAATLFGLSQLAFYQQVGLFRTAATVEALAVLIGAADATLLQRTLQAYSAACRDGSCVTTGKSVFPCTWAPDGSDGPFELAIVTPCIHYTMGGVAISSSAEVLVADNGAAGQAEVMRGAPVPGLYAAGEVTGGIHGANRLGGNSLLECVVFGRIAGAAAAAELNRGRTDF